MRKNHISDDSTAAIPIARHMLLETDDIDEAHAQVTEVFCPHRIDFSGRGRDLSFRQSFASMGSVALSYVRYGADVEIDAGEPGDWFMIHSTDQGQCAMQIGVHDVRATTGTDVVSSATTRLKMKWINNCGQLVLKIERAALEQHLRLMLNDDLRSPIEFVPDPTATSTSSYRRLIEFTASEAGQAESFFRSDLGSKHLENTLMTAVLTSFRHSHSERLETRGAQAVPRHVRLAEEFIRTHIEDPISVIEIAAAASVSVRTLFDGFKRFRGTTPMAYLKTIRLEGVRNDCIAAGPEASVTSIALKWGFTNLGRFADSYRKRYGELPSDTLRRGK
ncbi:AraC-type DNA-binding protein [Celeribacter baekdonensis]|jgi:AraC-like DNA-binding protein|uniref:AraC-type DNA-binding protein n=1 Tax=Celeribacter baekdonensis TaxID=875171 RepID=A0A1G7R868_9RHOB|nr:AraC family transcriptional regulator [Celeribacter baekdonensis]SDG06968.1 AraC-type DNA-binding protein [Celeribacter baekdonensis]